MRGRPSTFSSGSDQVPEQLTHRWVGSTRVTGSSPDRKPRTRPRGRRKTNCCSRTLRQFRKNLPKCDSDHFRTETSLPRSKPTRNTTKHPPRRQENVLELNRSRHKRRSGRDLRADDRHPLLPGAVRAFRRRSLDPANRPRGREPPGQGDLPASPPRITRLLAFLPQRRPWHFYFS
jgi:hypothetical protein